MSTPRSPPHANSANASGLRKRKNPENEDYTDFCKEMKKLLNDLREQQDAKFGTLNAALEANTLQNKSLLESNAEIQKLLLESKKECVELKNRVKNLEIECARSQIKINKLEEQLEDLQQFQKRHMLEIRNVPREECENLSEMLDVFMKSLEMERVDNEVKQIYRRGKENAPIVVEFQSYEAKNEVLQAVKSFRKTGKRLTCEKFGLANNNGPFFISEVLTARTKALLHAAKNIAIGGNYKYCWTSNGRVMLRKDDGKPAIRVLSFEHLENLKCLDPTA